jgi:hypothetical protein
MKPENQSCGVCVFYFPNSETPNGGKCHRNPPVRLGPGAATFPPVPESEWCGEWLALLTPKREGCSTDLSNFLPCTDADVLRMARAIELAKTKETATEFKARHIGSPIDSKDPLSRSERAVAEVLKHADKPVLATDPPVELLEDKIRKLDAAVKPAILEPEPEKMETVVSATDMALRAAGVDPASVPPAPEPRRAPPSVHPHAAPIAELPPGRRPAGARPPAT